jgi:pyruvate ferredoxin oxidoreductase beta subunit
MCAGCGGLHALHETYDIMGEKKNLFDIWVAHRPAYAATVIGAEPLDLARKVEKTMSITGPKLLLALAPCPTGWDFDPKLTVDIGRLAVRTGVWPLKEYVDGRVVHTKHPRERKPVEDYLRLQGRFAHLFEPERIEAELASLQERVDAYWAGEKGQMCVAPSMSRREKASM